MGRINVELVLETGDFLSILIQKRVSSEICNRLILLTKYLTNIHIG